VDYYATDENNIAVLRWLFAENDLHVYETCTGYDREPRGFHSADDAIVALHLSRPERKPGLLLLSLWAPDAGGELDLRRRNLEVPGYSWREEIGGWGVLSLQLGGLMPDGLQPSHLAVNSAKRARLWEDTYTKWGPADAWDWTVVARVMRRVSAWIRRQGVDRTADGPSSSAPPRRDLSQQISLERGGIAGTFWIVGSTLNQWRRRVRIGATSSSATAIPRKRATGLRLEFRAQQPTALRSALHA